MRGPEHRAALGLLAGGGRSLTCSCSHHVTTPIFEEILRPAAAGLPESEYLKVFLLERVD